MKTFAEQCREVSDKRYEEIVDERQRKEDNYYNGIKDNLISRIKYQCTKVAKEGSSNFTWYLHDLRMDYPDLTGDMLRKLALELKETLGLDMVVEHKSSYSGTSTRISF